MNLSDDILLRRILYAGVLTAAFVVAAWILFFTLQLGWGLLGAGAFGASFALAVHGAEHYFKTARAEASGQAPASHGHGEDAGKPGSATILGVARLGSVMFLILFLACEHLLGDMVRHMLRPVLVSVITLTPVGMLAAAFCTPGDSDNSMNPILIVLKGALFGVVAGGVASGLRWIAGLPVDFSGAYGWWAIAGLGLAAFAFGRELRIWRAVLGILTALALVVVVAKFGITSSMIKSTGWMNWFVRIGVSAAESALQAPDMPADVWADALERWQEEHPVGANEAGSHSAWGGALADWLGLPEPSPKILKRPTRAEQLGRELRKGFSSGLVRSWTVLVLFGVGLGATRWIEPLLRPAKYDTSQTKRNDLILGGVLLGLILGGAVLVRFLPNEAQHESAAPTEEPTAPGVTIGRPLVPAH